MRGKDVRGFVEFAFASTAAAGVPASVFVRLARQAGEFNRRMGITGYLDLQDGRFSCLLEGAEEAMLPLAARILADSRHGSIVTHAFRAIERRRYSEWSTGGADLAGVTMAENVRGLPERRPTVVRSILATASIHRLHAGLV